MAKNRNIETRTKPLGFGEADDDHPRLVLNPDGTIVAGDGVTPPGSSPILPAGGTTDQVLGKLSDGDFDADWVDAPSGTSGGPDSWLLLEQGNNAAQVLALNTDSVQEFIEFDTQFQAGGAALTWAIGSPTIINAAAGWYTAYGTIFFHFANPGDAATALVFPQIGNIQSSWKEIGPGAALPAVLNPIAGNTTEYSQDYKWPLWLLAADEAPESSVCQ